MSASWVIAGGGTGGHVTLALALGEEIVRRGDRVLFIGSDHGLEARLVPSAGFELEALPARQVMGRSLPGRARGISSLLAAALPARRALARVDADLVISVGGYAAMPALLAALVRRTPVALLEPNAVPGRVNRLAARIARRVFVGFEAARGRLRGRDARCVGIPLRRELLERFAALERHRPASPFHLLGCGGSEGARQGNDAMIEVAPELAQFPVEVFHQSGEADRERVAAAYRSAGIEAEVVAFEPDMPPRYAWADVAIGRAGALTVAELAMVGLPSILIPYPYAADDHQRANAAALEAAGAALRLDSRHLEPERIVDALASWFAAPVRLEEMGRAARGLARPDAAAAVVDACRELFEAAPLEEELVR